MTRSSASTYRPDIDGLRAVAVLLVVLFHLDVPGFSGGYVGVDVFFVISGYLITDRIRAQREAGTWSITRFYVKRIRRLVPALTVTIALVLLFAALLLDAGLTAATAESAVFASLSIANFHFWLTSGYFDVGAHARPLLHTWSLGIEEQFYLLWPALLGVALASRRRLAALGVFTVATFVASEVLFADDPPAAFFLLHARFIELAIGAALALNPGTRPASAPPRGLLGTVGLAAAFGVFAFATLTFDDTTRFPSYPALVVCAASAAAIACGRAPVLGRLLDNPVATWIGRVSYSAYLVHWPLIVFVEYALFREPDAFETALLFAATFAGAALMHHGVERRFRYGAKDGRFLVGQLVATVAVALVALHGAQDGWPGRLDATASAFAAARGKTGYTPCRESDVVCRVGAVGPTHLVVIGDSHAKHLIHGVDAYAKQRGVAAEILTENGCAPLPGVTTARKGVVRQLCLKSRDTIDGRLAELQPRLVVYSLAYLGYRPAFVEPDGTPIPFADDDAFARYFAERLEASMDRIRAPRFGVVLPSLRPGFDPVECLGRPRILDRRDAAQRCPIPPAAQALASSRAVVRALEALAERRDDLTLLDPNVALCPDGACRVVDDGRLLYSDHHHLTAPGADLVVASFADQLDALLEGR